MLASSFYKWSKRRAKRSFNRPAKCFDASLDRVVVEPKFLAPLRECLAPPTVLNKSIRSPIKSLLFSRRPPAIARLIISIVVNSLDRHAGWTLPDVRNEMSETAIASPSVANYDSAFAVIWKLLVSFVVAPRNHAFKNSVFWRQRWTRPVAPAFLRLWPTKKTNALCLFSTAEAAADVSRLSVRIWRGQGDDGPPSKCFANHLSPFLFPAFVAG